MFTRSDLSTLVNVNTRVAVSIYLGTHVSGADTRQDPIRLKNLIAAAREKLLGTGMHAPEASSLLEPASQLVDDAMFWQHQDQGLALFLDGGEPHVFHVPLELDEQVVVGPGFHVKPLLPLLAADGAFLVLTLTAHKVCIFNASRFSMVEDTEADLPKTLPEMEAEYDYENHVQASPIARPRTGALSISNAQVYGDSPNEWRKGQLVEFSKKVAAAVEGLVRTRPLPLVLVADAELGGHFRKACSLGEHLAGVIETNPEALDRQQLHDAAYAVVQDRLDGVRRDAVNQLEALRNKDDGGMATSIEDVVKAAYRGQVDTLLLQMDQPVWGHYDVDHDQVVRAPSPEDIGEDLVQTSAIQTLANGGSVHLLSPDDLTNPPPAAAILRY